MFAGIVESKQPILSARTEGKCKRVRMAKPRSWKLSLGESVSVDGICSTVVANSSAHFEVEYMPETLMKTTASSFQMKRIVNIERSLKYGDRIHGHFVMGHVDSVVRVASIEMQGRSRLVTFSLPRQMSKFVVPRGSVAVNGVSLTVARKERGSFAVALIPHTLAITNLEVLQVGDAVNIECDVMARYGLAAIHQSATVRVHEKEKRKK